MAAAIIGRASVRTLIPQHTPRIRLDATRFRHHIHHPRSTHPRTFTSSSARCEQQTHRKESFSSRLKTALGKTKIVWYPIPVGLGIASLGLLQFYKIQKRETAARVEEEQERASSSSGGSDDGEPGRPKKRPRIRPSGPW